MKKQIILMLLISIVFSLLTFAQAKKYPQKSKPVPVMKDKSVVVSKPLVTFVELGSVNCIPCKAMQKVMKSVEEKFGDQIKIVFYDVWTQEQAPYAQKYGIRLIPTQIFLDVNGKELMRHEGYYPENDIDVFLQSKGLKPKVSAKE